MTIFETKHLIIRQLGLNDVDDLHSICSSEELMKYVGEGIPLSREQVANWIDITLVNYKEKGFGNYAVVSKAENEFIGYCGLVYSKEIDDIELIYALKKSYWYKGFGSEVASAMIRYGLETVKLDKIFASIDPENIPSKRILEKVGFRFIFKRPDEYGYETDFYMVTKSST